MVLSVKFFEGSSVAECPTFEIKLSNCYVNSHISLEGEFSSEESDVD